MNTKPLTYYQLKNWNHLMIVIVILLMQEHFPHGVHSLCLSSPPSSTKIRKNTDAHSYQTHHTIDMSSTITSRRRLTTHPTTMYAANPSTATTTSSTHDDEIVSSTTTKSIMATKDESQQLQSQQSPLVTIQDFTTILQHVIFCFICSIIVSFYEGYDCSYLKPLPATIRQFPTENEISIVQNQQNQQLQQEQQQQLQQQAILDDYLSQHHNNIITDSIQLMKSGTRGMGRGEIDRINGWFQATYFGADYDTIANDNENTVGVNVDDDDDDDEIIPLTPYQLSKRNVNALRNIQSYNEVMKYHREYRVQKWKEYDESMIMKSSSSTTTTTTSSPSTITKASQRKQIENAIHTIYVALDTLEQLKLASNEYEWDVMEELLQSDILKIQLGNSCNLLRSSVGYLDLDARQEIGFDWGSCAWRHCGAQADAQEALAELYNSIGLFEPFECLFTIDIVERSLRDIINVVPIQYHSKDDIEHLQTYVPYKSQQEIDFENGVSDNDDGMDSSDVDYLNVLSGLRNNDVDDDVDDDGIE